MDPASTDSPNVVELFFADQIARLSPLEFVALGSSKAPQAPMEIARLETGELSVRVPIGQGGTLPDPIQAKLREAGFRSDDSTPSTESWTVTAADPEEATAIAVDTLEGVFGVTIDGTANLIHGSHRAEHEAAERLEELRGRVEPLLTEMLGHPPTTDDEGDYLYPIEHILVRVVPRVLPGALAVIRVVAVTNTGVAVGPDLALFLARLNFGMMFGRFTLDAENQAVWFDETLLGQEVSDEELAFTIRVVASTAGQWDQRVQEMFGGSIHRDALAADSAPIPKPGYGGYTGYL